MPGNSSWMPYAPQGVKGFDDDDMLHGILLVSQPLNARRWCKTLTIYPTN